MKREKGLLLLPPLYLAFTLACGILGWLLQDEQGIVFRVWYFISAVIWFSLWIRIVVLIGISDSMKDL